MILENRVAIVTGSSHGIGEGIALEFAREGANVVVVGLTAVEAAHQVAQKIEDMGRKAIVVMTDVRDRSQVDKMVNTTIEQFGKVDVLVNNAGIIKLTRFREMTDEIWNDVLDTHLKGTYNCSKAVLEHMIQQKYGKIINLASPAALVGGYGFTAYGTAKGGIISLTRVMARELGRYGINVNCISPSADTRMLDEFKKIPNYWEETVRGHVLGQPTSADVAPVFAFLASDGARTITGQIIRADAGLVLGP